MPAAASRQSIVGLGAVSAYGWGVEALVKGMESRKAAAGLVPADPPLISDQPVWAARVPEGGLPHDGRTLFVRALRAAAREAVSDAIERGWSPGPQVGLIIAATNGDWQAWTETTAWRQGRSPRIISQIMPGTWSSAIMREFDFHGPSMVAGAACASGMLALMVARDWIRLGRVSDVLVVGADLAATPVHIRQLATWRVSVHSDPPHLACLPFSDATRGFSEGEACAAVMLTNHHAAAYVDVAGTSASSDGWSWAAIAEDHQHILRCVQLALQEAAVDTEQVGVFHAHGTGTRSCNAAERAVLSHLGDHVRVTAVKPMTGHCHPASPTLETLLVAKSHQLSRLLAAPAAPGADPQVVDGCIDWSPQVGVQLAMGMGGHNAAAVLVPPAL